MDTLLAKLSEQQALLAKKNKPAMSTTGSDEENINPGDGSSSGSTHLTPNSDGHNKAQNMQDQGPMVRQDAAELARLKRELDEAKDRLARQAQEINQSRVIKQSLDQTMSATSDMAMSPILANHTGQYPPVGRQGWNTHDDLRSETSDYNAPPSIWSGPSRNGPNQTMQTDSAWGFGGGRPFNPRGSGNPMSLSYQQSMSQRNYSVPVSPPGSSNGRGMNEFNAFNHGRGFGQFSSSNNRNNSVFGPRNSNFDMFSAGPPVSSAETFNLGGMNPGSAYQNMGVYQGYQPQPIGTPLSPTANEFRAGQGGSNPWNPAVRHNTPSAQAFDS